MQVFEGISLLLFLKLLALALSLVVPFFLTLFIIYVYLCHIISLRKRLKNIKDVSEAMLANETDHLAGLSFIVCESDIDLKISKEQKKRQKRRRKRVDNVRSV